MEPNAASRATLICCRRTVRYDAHPGLTRASMYIPAYYARAGAKLSYSLSFLFNSADQKSSSSPKAQSPPNGQQFLPSRPTRTPATDSSHTQTPIQDDPVKDLTTWHFYSIFLCSCFLYEESWMVRSHVSSTVDQATTTQCVVLGHVKPVHLQCRE